MITILDVNNFWSPSGGGVRRYHLERMEFYRNQTEFRVVFLMQDSKAYTEVLSDCLIVEHVVAFKIPGDWDYRFIWQPWLIRKFVKKYLPDIIEVGSPYWLPIAVRWSLWGLKKRPVMTGFWHADFPVTYVRRGFSHIHPLLGRWMESLAWCYAQWAFSGYHSLQVSSCEIMHRMMQKGLERVHWIPLGVDVDLFSPEKKRERIVQDLKAGKANRLTVFFPHRLTEEKGVPTLLAAYPSLCERLGVEPSIVFASIGPYRKEVEAAAIRYPHIRYIGFVKSAQEMAEWYASTELGLALSGWETFGLSILESMASGQVIVGTDMGAAKEHVEASKAGRTIPTGDVDALVNAITDIVESGAIRSDATKSRTYAETFTWRACFERQRSYYLKVIGG